MARLQELQHTVTGGTKLVAGVSLSPRSGRNYLRTSLRCKQESLRLKGANSRRSSPGKLPVSKEEWRKMSLPAMLLGETMGEILQASQFARNAVEAVCSKTQKPAADDPKTPVTKQKPTLDNSGLHARRRKEKEIVLQVKRSESNVPSARRAKSKINFKVSPLQNRECDKENCRYIANRVSPRNRPWVRKTVLFPNPLFHSSPTSQHQKFGKTKSPVIARNRQSTTTTTTPHKFLIKSPTAASKFQVKIRSPPICISPTRASKKSPRASSAAARLRRSFSPSRLASKLVSPLKSRKSMQKSIEGMKIMSGLKQRPASFSLRFSPRRN